jgi:hypothetical protein
MWMNCTANAAFQVGQIGLCHAQRIVALENYFPSMGVFNVVVPEGRIKQPICLIKNLYEKGSLPHEKINTN